MPIYETTPKRNNNASFSFYKDRKHYVHTLWVTELEQPHQIVGTRRQSAHTAHWYPKSYSPGNFSVVIRCRSQTDYQRLANFVRLHHRLMLETPGLRFSTRKGSTGLRHLMHFQVPSEAITVRGWIPSFTITKRGVFEPAPEVRFEFFAALDPYSHDPIISHKIREWWNSAKMKPTDPFVIDPEAGKPNRVTPEVPVDSRKILDEHQR